MSHDPQPIDTLPKDGRWFLGYDPTLKGSGWPTKPWVIAHRCDGGFSDHDGNGVDPVLWAPLPDPQPEPTGWKWPEGSIEIIGGHCEALGWRGFLVDFVKPDGSLDAREPIMCDTLEEAQRRAAEEAKWSGLPVKMHETLTGENVVPLRARLHGKSGEAA